MLFLLLRVFEEFRQEHGFYAGLADHNDDSQEIQKQRAEKEFQWLKTKAEEYVAKITPDTKFENDNYIHELMRYSDSKIHTISAFLGGVASQEIIKLLIN